MSNWRHLFWRFCKIWTILKFYYFFKKSHFQGERACQRMHLSNSVPHGVCLRWKIQNWGLKISNFCPGRFTLHTGSEIKGDLPIFRFSATMWWCVWVEGGTLCRTFWTSTTLAGTGLHQMRVSSPRMDKDPWQLRLFITGIWRDFCLGSELSSFSL